MSSIEQRFSKEFVEQIHAIPSELEHNLMVFAKNIERETDGLPAELASKIRHDGEKLFLERAQEAIPRGARLAPLVAEVVAEARESARLERERLKPPSVADALEPWFGPLDDHGWRAAEKAAIESMLEQGEKPTAVDFRAMTTNRRTITRDDVRQFALGQRPRWQVDLPDSLRPSEFLARAGFPTDEAIMMTASCAARSTPCAGWLPRKPICYVIAV